MTEIISARTFHIVGDTHITGDPANIRDSQVQKLADDLIANSIPTPVARLQVGDLVDLGTPAEDAVAIDFMDALGGPWYAAGGNHDVYGNVRTFEQWAASLGYSSPNYVVDHGDVRSMHVAPTGADQVGPLSQTTLAWMHAELQTNPTVPYMVVCHRPLYNTADPTGTHSFNSTTSGPTRYQSPNLDIREVLANNGNVVAWISGHIHPKIDAPLLWKAETVGNRRMLHLVAPSTWQAGPPSGSLHDQVYSYFLQYGVEGGFESLIVRDHVTQTEAEAVLPETDWIVEPDPVPSTVGLPASMRVDTNLLVDWATGTYDFEAGITDWTTVVSATLSHETSLAHGGTGSLKVVTPGGAVNEGTRTGSTILVPPSRKYGAKVWARAPVGATMELLLWERTAANGNVGSTAATFVGTGDWQLVTVERTFGATGEIAWIVVRTRTTAQALTFHVDDVGLGTEEGGVSTTALPNLLPEVGISADAEANTVLVSYDFEANITGWGAASGATVSRDTVSPITGVGSLKVDTPGTALYEGVRIESPYVNATPGTGYTLTATVNAPNGATLRVRLAEYDSAGDFIAATDETFTGTGAAQAISASRTLGSSGAKIGVRIETRTTAQAITFRVDGVAIGTALAGWAPTSANAVISRDTVTPLAGTASMKVVTAGVATDEGVRISNHFSVDPGHTYQLSFVAKAPAASTLNVTLAEYDEDDVSVDSTTVSFNGTGAAQTVLVTHVFSEAGVRAGVRIDTRVTPQAITFHVDSLKLGQPKILTAPSRTYTASAWVHAPSGAALRLVLEERELDNDIVGEAATPLTGTGAWKYVEVDKTFGANGQRALVWVDTGTSALPVAFNVGDVRLSTATLHPPATRNFTYDYETSDETEYAYRIRTLAEISAGNYDPAQWASVLGELGTWLEPVSQTETLTVEAEATAASVRVWVMGGSDDSPGQYLIDAAQLIAEAEASDYFDGSSGGQWSGSAHASASAAYGPTARKTVKVGLERYHYDAAAPSELWLDEGELTETTPSNTVADADASGGNAIELLGLFPGWQDVALRTGDTRRGTFRVWARVKVTADEEEIQVRLKWRVGAGPYTVNALAVVAVFATAAYVEVDLGIVQIPAGAANLDLIVQAHSDSPTSAAEGVRIDALSPQPAERTATVEGEEVITGGQTLSVYDGFDHGAVSDPLTATAPEIGTGNWTGAGDADDFKLVASGASRLPPATDADLNTGRYLTAGGALTTTTLVGHFTLRHTGKGTAQETRGGFIVRNPMSAGNPDPLNWLGILVRIRRKASGNYKKTLRLYKRVAGTVTLLKEVDVDETALGASRGLVSGGIAISVDAAGVVSVATGGSTSEEPTNQIAGLSTTDSVLATAGALASGEAGIYHAADFGDRTNVSMYVHDLAVYSSVSSITNTYAIPSGGRLELDGSEAISYSAPSGGTAVPVALRGAAFALEPAGSEAKTTRVAVEVRDNAPGEADAGLTRATKVKATYRPTYLLGPGP